MIITRESKFQKRITTLVLKKIPEVLHRVFFSFLYKLIGQKYNLRTIFSTMLFSIRIANLVLISTFVATVWTGPITDRPNICTGNKNGIFIQNTSDCRAYYICNNNIPYLAYCPPGKLFNYVTRLCDQPDNVDCFKCPSHFQDLAVPNECNQFIRCNKNVSIQLTCSNGLLFDATLEQCNIASKVKCDFKVICPKNQDFLFFIIDRDSCNK